MTGREKERKREGRDFWLVRLRPCMLPLVAVEEEGGRIMESLYVPGFTFPLWSIGQGSPSRSLALEIFLLIPVV